MRKNKYLERVPEITAEMERLKKHSERVEDEYDQPYHVALLGSVMSLFPSGKYYTPWARSNVNPCSVCGGSGQSKRTKACRYCQGCGERVANEFTARSFLIERGLSVGDTFPCNVCGGAGEVHYQCAACGGVGSQEAYQDELYGEALAQAANAAGGWVENGEGDPTDVFFAFTTAEDESERNQETNPGAAVLAACS